MVINFIIRGFISLVTWDFKNVYYLINVWNSSFEFVMAHFVTYD
jgi:hypothetical protein